MAVGPLARLLERIRTTRAEIGDAWPYHADPETGRWETTDDGDWCGGHWVECLRLASVLEDDPELLDEALERTERLRPYLERDDQFRGHRFGYSSARLYDHTGREELRTLTLAAAWAMRAMAMPVHGAMPIGLEVQVKSTTLASRSIVAVDNVHPNLLLDWWARTETGDPTFERGARRHLDRTIADFVRPDGSTVEFIEYDPTTGAVLREFTLLGAHDGSCWSRGQAWAIAGFLRAWEELGDSRYLAVARHLFDYWWDHTDEHRIPPWDFMDPAIADGADVPLDTSAAAIVVEQLARLRVHPDLAAAAPDLVARLDPMLEGLEHRLTPTHPGDPRPPGMLVEGCFNHPRAFADRAELLWGDAYYLMALAHLELGRAPR
ncbi:MAG TPA: hypothetical protein ENK55_02000 [Actinobacteria bacterium]|nr:hypothetical protein [Actinomycetota bacterium]